MITLDFLLYFLIGLQLIFKPNAYIKIQFVFCLLITLIDFNFHSHLLRLL